MDVNALNALATAALTAHAPEDLKGAGMTAVANGAEFPDALAYQVIGLTDQDDLALSSAFCIGFNIALQLAAMIVKAPLECPDLEHVLAEAKRELSACRRGAVA